MGNDYLVYDSVILGVYKRVRRQWLVVSIFLVAGMLFGYYNATTDESYTGVIKIEFAPVTRGGQVVALVDIKNEVALLNHEVEMEERVYGTVVAFEADLVSSTLKIVGTGDRANLEALLSSIASEIGNEIVIKQVELIENETQYLEGAREFNVKLINDIEADPDASNDSFLTNQHHDLVANLLEIELAINDLLEMREDVYIMQAASELIIASNSLNPFSVIIWPAIIAILTFIFALYSEIFDGRIRRRYDVEKVIDNVDVISVLPNNVNSSETVVFSDSVNHFSTINNLQKLKFRNLGNSKKIDIGVCLSDESISIPTSFDMGPVFSPSKGTGLILLLESSKITQGELLSEISNLRFAGQEKIGIVLFGVPRADIDWASVSLR
jgi:hypothetical protein